MRTARKLKTPPKAKRNAHQVGRKTNRMVKLKQKFGGQRVWLIRRMEAKKITQSEAHSQFTKLAREARQHGFTLPPLDAGRVTVPKPRAARPAPTEAIGRPQLRVASDNPRPQPNMVSVTYDPHLYRAEVIPLGPSTPRRALGTVTAPKTASGRARSKAVRDKQSRAMKRYWANRRKAKTAAARATTATKASKPARKAKPAKAAASKAAKKASPAKKAAAPKKAAKRASPAKKQAVKTPAQKPATTAPAPAPAAPPATVSNENTQTT